MAGWVLSVFLILFMTGCGFHLRGAYQLPEAMAKTYVQASNQNSELIRSLKRSLKANRSEERRVGKECRSRW